MNSEWRVEDVTIASYGVGEEDDGLVGEEAEAYPEVERYRGRERG